MPHTLPEKAFLKHPARYERSSKLTCKNNYTAFYRHAFFIALIGIVHGNSRRGYWTAKGTCCSAYRNICEQFCARITSRNSANKTGYCACSSANSCGYQRIYANSSDIISIPDWVILAICEHIGGENTVGVCSGKCVGIYEPAGFRVIVPALEIVQPRLDVVVISPVPQRVYLSRRSPDEVSSLPQAL